MKINELIFYHDTKFVNVLLQTHHLNDPVEMICPMVREFSLVKLFELNELLGIVELTLHSTVYNKNVLVLFSFYHNRVINKVKYMKLYCTKTKLP